MKRLLVGCGLVVAALVASSPRAEAFCGFYVSAGGSGAKMFNDATQVVLVRDGTRTVLAMQNDYKGPLEDFAMVVPVPVVLHDGDVKTLSPAVFDHVDTLGSPRLVEYWEENPCPEPQTAKMYDRAPMASRGAGYGAGSGRGGGEMPPPKVVIEAKFDVAEYQVLVLSSTEAAGLETWLKDNKYKIPDGAEPLLRPYVEAGMKFFVAKVDPKKVHMVDGHAALSPLRFGYDADDFALPIRLGLANSSGKQDLIVNIISPDKRYEVANYKNVFVPTNFDVTNTVRSHFGEFYAALFDQTAAANPRAVITEYAWSAKPQYHCDPCPGLDVTNADLLTLGADLVPKLKSGNFVLTRLHARYGKTDMKDDLRFKEAKAVTGGREEWSKEGIEYGAKTADSGENAFQARYVIRHWWNKAIKCKNPQRGVWGGPWDDVEDAGGTIAASKVAFAPRRGFDLAKNIGRDLWEIGYKKQRATPPPPKGPVLEKADPPKGGVGGGSGKGVKIQMMSFGGGALAAAVLLLAIGGMRRRRG